MTAVDLLPYQNDRHEQRIGTARTDRLELAGMAPRPNPVPRTVLRHHFSAGSTHPVSGRGIVATGRVALSDVRTPVLAPLRHYRLVATLDDFARLGGREHGLVVVSTVRA